MRIRSWAEWLSCLSLSRRARRLRRSPVSRIAASEVLEGRQLLDGVIGTMFPMTVPAVPSSGTQPMGVGVGSVTGIGGASSGATSIGSTTSGSSASGGSNTTGTSGGSSSSGTGATERPQWLIDLVAWQKTLTAASDRYAAAGRGADDLLRDRLTTIFDANAAAELQRQADRNALSTATQERLESVMSSVDGQVEDSEEQADSVLARIDRLGASSQSLRSTLDTKVKQADDIYRASVDRIRGVRDRLTALAESDYQSALAKADRDRDAALADSKALYAGSLAAAAGRLDAAIDSAQQAFEQAAETVVNSLGSAIDAEFAAYGATLEVAKLTRDTTISGLSRSFDPHVPETDAAYQEALDAARAHLDGQIAQIVENFSSKMESLGETYDDAMADADSVFQSAIDEADSAYTNTVREAYQTHRESTSTAVSEFDGKVVELQAEFDRRVVESFTTYDESMDKADATYEKSTTAADKKRDKVVADAEKAYSDYKTAAPQSLTEKVQDAAGVWADGIMAARDTLRSKIPDAAAAHLKTARDALKALSSQTDSGMSGVLSAVTERLSAAATTASARFEIDVSKSIGTFSSYEAYLVASQKRLSDALLAYVNSVGRAADSEIETVRDQARGKVVALFEVISQGIRDLANADVELTVAQAEVRLGMDKAQDVGQAVFYQTLADLQEQAILAFHQQTETYKKALNDANAERETTRSQAVADRTLARTAAGKTLIDALAKSEREYVDSYTQSWKTMRESLVAARDTLVESAAQADRDWNTTLDNADAAWAESAKKSADDYTRDVAEEREQATARLQSVTDAYVGTVYDLWTTGMRAAYSASSELDEFLGAWRQYGGQVMDAWTQATGAFSSVVNLTSRALNTASNSELHDTVVATHAHNVEMTNAEIAQMVAAAEALRQFDATYTREAVARARKLVDADTQRDEDQASEAKQAIDAQATAAKEAITQGVENEKETLNQFADSTNQIAREYFEAAYSTARAAQEESEKLTREEYDQAIQEAREAAVQTRDNLLAGLEFLKSQRLRELDRQIEEARGAMQKQLADLQSGDLAKLIIFETDAGHGRVPAFLVSSFSSAFRPVNSLYEQVSNQAAGLLERQLATLPANPTRQQALEGAGPDAYSTIRMILGLTGRVEYRDQVGADYVGMYDISLGMVIRSTQRSVDGPFREVARPFETIRDLDAKCPLWGAIDWNSQFGGINLNSPVDPETQTLTYRGLSFLIGEEKMAQNDGLMGDVLITVQLVTEAVGVVDPTGVSDALNAVVCLAQGDRVGAAMSVASIVVPFGADKLVKHANKVPNGVIARCVNKVDDFCETAGATYKKLVGRTDEAVAQSRQVIAKGQQHSLDAGLSACIKNDGCFVAGTQVVVAVCFTTVEPAASGDAGDTEHVDLPALSMLLSSTAFGLLAIERPRLRETNRRRWGKLSDRQRNTEKPTINQWLEEEFESMGPFHTNGDSMARASSSLFGMASDRPNEMQSAGISVATPSDPCSHEVGPSYAIEVARPRGGSAARTSEQKSDPATNSLPDVSHPTTPRPSTGSVVRRRRQRSETAGNPSRFLAACVAVCLAIFVLVGGSFTPGKSRTGDSSATRPQHVVDVESAVRYETRNIEDLVAGDRVVAWDEQTGRLGLKQIEETFRHKVNHVRHLRIQDVDGRLENVDTTDVHPFWVENEGWVSARDLVPGDRLHDGQSRPATVMATRRVEHPDGIEVYNFRVADWHTYLVASSVAESTPVVVHNANCAETLTLSILGQDFVPDGRKVLQNVTDRVNAQFATDLSSAATVLTPDELLAAGFSRGIARMQYGNALERKVAGVIESDAVLDSLFDHIGGKGMPDFVGNGVLLGEHFDITTPAQVMKHLSRPGYGNGLKVITYERPPGF